MPTNRSEPRPSARYDHAYAIVRFDRSAAADLPAEHRITIKKIVFDAEVAASEVQRLNELNSDKGCEYFCQITRLERAEPVESLVESSVLVASPG